MPKKFDHKILIIGYGSVSQCTLPVLLEKIDVDPKNITIMDFEDKAGALKKFTDKGIKFVRERITPENLGAELAKYTDNGGLIIDLAWNIGANDIISWCHDHNVLYVNTSVEVWDSIEGLFKDSPFEKSLYWRQMKLRELSKDWKNATTAVVDHGANPGLISHFVKQGLIDIANKLIADKKAVGKDKEELEDYIKNRKFNLLGQKLGVKVIHCSERDTQITNRPKEVNEFVGTWSIEGLREEGTAPAEMGWGTHEQKLPALAHVPPYGPKNQIALAQMGINTWVRSWIPNEEIVGMVIRHGEAFGLSDRLTVWEGDRAIYRPTVHYAYMPCHETLSSLCELRGRNYELPPKLRIMEDEITSGADILGALMMGHEYNSWWTGSALTIEEARRLAPGQNATTLQVALGVISAVLWMMENPKQGICLPDDLPHDFVLDIAKPFLGDFISTPSDWTPLKNRMVYFKENPASRPAADTWQFENFLFLP
ncbi:MAG: saccharopine dehydrogenase NADP-binding domain-containing protein [Candidatus Doudnabacteria bacterium]|nr:saccharopine dehydrogenase NADP-binding domain-containing protein [Candidatus Doudnabacteria bacterium]